MNLIPFTLDQLCRNWKLLLLATLAIALAFQTVRLSASRAALQAEKVQRQADHAEYAKAQSEAAQIALRAKIEKDAENVAKAEQADDRYAALSAQYRAAIVRAKAAQGTGRATDLPSASESAASVDRSGGSPVFPVGNILIPEADAFICATNTARLQAAREWAMGLD